MAISNVRLKFTNENIDLKSGDYFIYNVGKKSIICVFKDYIYNNCIRYFVLNADGISSSKMRKISLDKINKISVYNEANYLKKEVDNFYKEQLNNSLPEKYICPNCNKPHYDLHHKIYYKITNNKKQRTKTTCKNILCRAEFFLTIKNNKFQIKYNEKNKS